MRSTDRLPSTAHGLVFAGGVCAVALAEAALAPAILRSSIPLAGVVALHLTAVALLILLAVAARRAGVVSAAIHVLVLLVAMLGPFGLVGTMLVIALSRLFARRTAPFAAWRTGFFADEPADRIAHLDAGLARAMVPQASAVVPFAEIMVTGSVAQKQAVLGLVADHYGPRHAPILRSALNDKDLIIRVHAASIASHLENGFQSRIADARQRAGENPSDGERAAELADLLDDYARCGLADDQAADDARQAALQIYASRLPQPGHDHLAEREARLLLETGCADEAIRRLWPKGAARTLSPGAARILLSALTRERRFADLRRLAEDLARFEPAAGRDDPLRDLLLPWRTTPADARSLP